MSRIYRLGTIIKVVIRYRLDELVGAEKQPFLRRGLLKVARIIPKNKQPRGVRIRRALEDLGPIFIKFGQLLSTRPDLIPPDICEELDRLQDNVPPFHSEEFIGIVERELGMPVDELFQQFNRKPMASASVAQVHAAVLPDGSEVVVKVVRPGIEKVIQQDIRLLLTIARWVEKNTADGWRLRPVEVVQDYSQTIFDELNLQREGANASLLRSNFEQSPLLYIPKIYWNYSNEKVLVSERIRAIPVTNMGALREKNVNFKLLAERGVELFFTQVFDHNFFHADMHPGNIFIDASNPEEPSYLAVDCAIMGSLTEADQYYLARNLLAIFRRDYRQVAELHLLSGWVPPETSEADFAAAIRTVCEPIFQRPFSELSFAHIVINLFRTARRFDMEVQPSLVLLEKTLINIEGLGRQLYPELDLWATAHPFLERWVKNRFMPNALMETIKRHGPEWIEQFPQMPQRILDFLDQPRIQATSLPRNTRRTAAREQAKKRPLLPLAGAASLGVSLGLAFPFWGQSLQHLPVSSLIFGSAGILLLLLRR